MLVCGWNKHREHVVGLTHRHNQTLLLPPAPDVTFSLPLQVGSPFPNLPAARQLCAEGTWGAKDMLPRGPRGVPQEDKAHLHCSSELLLL